MQEKLEKKHQPTYLQKTIKAHKNQTKSPSWLDGNQFKATEIPSNFCGLLRKPEH